MGHETIGYSPQIENEKKLTQSIFMLVKPFTTTPGTLRNATINYSTCLCVCFHSGAGNFEIVLCIVTG